MTFIEQLNWRYATKKFDPTKEVSPAIEEQIMNAIRMAPSSFGLQPFHVTVVKNSDIKTKLRAAAWNQEQLETAPFTLVFSSRNDITSRIEQYFELASGGDASVKLAMQGYKDMMNGSLLPRTPAELDAWASKQAYIALGFAMAAAAELEVDTCPMEGFDSVQFKQILELPEGFHPAVILPVGYRSSDDVVRPKTRFDATDMFDMR